MVAPRDCKKFVNHNAMEDRQKASPMPRQPGSGRLTFHSVFEGGGPPVRVNKTRQNKNRGPVLMQCNQNRSGSTARERSERVPGRARGIFEIADVGTEPQPNAGAYRHQYD